MLSFATFVSKYWWKVFLLIQHSPPRSFRFILFYFPLPKTFWFSTRGAKPKVTRKSFESKHPDLAIFAGKVHDFNVTLMALTFWTDAWKSLGIQVGFSSSSLNWQHWRHEKWANSPLCKNLHKRDMFLEAETSWTGCKSWLHDVKIVLGGGVYPTTRIPNSSSSSSSSSVTKKCHKKAVLRFLLLTKLCRSIGIVVATGH